MAEKGRPVLTSLFDYLYALTSAAGHFDVSMCSHSYVPAGERRRGKVLSRRTISTDTFQHTQLRNDLRGFSVLLVF